MNQKHDHMLFLDLICQIPYFFCKEDLEILPLPFLCYIYASLIYSSDNDLDCCACMEIEHL